jgi:hypothetical protein
LDLPLPSEGLLSFFADFGPYHLRHIDNPLDFDDIETTLGVGIEVITEALWPHNPQLKPFTLEASLAARSTVDLANSMGGRHGRRGCTQGGSALAR